MLNKTGRNSFLLIFGIIIFIVALVIIIKPFGNNILSNSTITDSKNKNSASITDNNNIIQGMDLENTSSTAAKGLSIVDVSKHSAKEDCWVIINDKVYDVTSMIPNHPGGSQAVISQCGKDATSAFDMRNGRGPHPQRAQESLENYFVGNLSDS